MSRLPGLSSHLWILFLNVMKAKHDTNVTRKVSRTSVIYKSCRMCIYLFLHIYVCIWNTDVESRDQQLLPTYGQRWPPGNENPRYKSSRGSNSRRSLYVIAFITATCREFKSEAYKPADAHGSCEWFVVRENIHYFSPLVYSFPYHFTWF